MIKEVDIDENGTVEFAEFIEVSVMIVVMAARGCFVVTCIHVPQRIAARSR